MRFRFQLGSVRSLQRSGREVHGRLHFSSVSPQPFALVTEGHLTDVSAGYRVLQRIYVLAGSTKAVAGQTFTGPVNVTTRWKLYELSLTSLGADEQAKIRGLGADRAEAVQRALEEFSGRAMDSIEKLNALGGNTAETLGKLRESGVDVRERLPLTLAGLKEMIEEGLREAYQ